MQGQVTVFRNIDPRTVTIAVLPCKSSGNPNEEISWETTDKYEDYLRRNVGFNVVNKTWVVSKINELNIDPNSMTTKDLKTLKTELDCDYLFLSSINYYFQPSQSSSYGYGNARGNKANVQQGSSSQGGYYRLSSESVSLIDPATQETILTGNIQISDIPYYVKNRSMSHELTWTIYRYLYNDWPD